MRAAPARRWWFRAGPERLIKGGLPAEAMVASVPVSKYAWHVPLYRQAQMLAAQGLDIKRSTLAFWVGYAAASSNAFGNSREARELGWRVWSEHRRTYSLTGRLWMRTSERREPYKSRGSRTVLGAGVQFPPRDSLAAEPAERTLCSRRGMIPDSSACIDARPLAGYARTRRRRAIWR